MVHPAENEVEIPPNEILGYIENIPLDDLVTPKLRKLAATVVPKSEHKKKIFCDILQSAGYQAYILQINREFNFTGSSLSFDADKELKFYIMVKEYEELRKAHQIMAEEYEKLKQNHRVISDEFEQLKQSCKQSRQITFEDYKVMTEMRQGILGLLAQLVSLEQGLA
ncbi:hypothetical protein TWF481_002741 [Arthrobotrys musiformis]|uniref:Uncharacterized protein n=1 Tax=Arthrobotrys musiformis TaxID=47236 RepID=A0AAV9VSU2_9PEZI